MDALQKDVMVSEPNKTFHAHRLVPGPLCIAGSVKAFLHTFVRVLASSSGGIHQKSLEKTRDQLPLPSKIRLEHQSVGGLTACRTYVVVTVAVTVASWSSLGIAGGAIAMGFAWR
jgi:hypothetical protein